MLGENVSIKSRCRFVCNTKQGNFRGESVATKVGQLRFQESGGGVHKTKTLKREREKERERGGFELNFEMKFLNVKIFSQGIYISVY